MLFNFFLDGKYFLQVTDARLITKSNEKRMKPPFVLGGNLSLKRKVNEVSNETESKKSKLK